MSKTPNNIDGTFHRYKAIRPKYSFKLHAKFTKRCSLFFSYKNPRIKQIERNAFKMNITLHSF